MILFLLLFIFSSISRQIPAPYSKANGGTAIPLPATVLVQRRCPPDKVRPLPPTPNHAPCKYLPMLPTLLSLLHSRTLWKSWKCSGVCYDTFFTSTLRYASFKIVVYERWRRGAESFLFWWNIIWFSSCAFAYEITDIQMRGDQCIQECWYIQKIDWSWRWYDNRP